jgi:SAM-dependent methyltransferase
VQFTGPKFKRRLDQFFVPNLRESNSINSAKLTENLFDYLAPKYDEIITPGLNVAVWRKLAEYAGILIPQGKAPLKVLDFGVGTGHTTEAAICQIFGIEKVGQLPFQLYGVDLSPRMIQICERARRSLFYDLRRCIDSKEGIPFPSRFFDVVIACYVQHYFTDTIPLLAIRHVLKPGGIVAMNLHDTNIEEVYHWLDKKLSFTSIELVTKKIYVDSEYKPITMCFARRPLEDKLTSPGENTLWDFSFSKFHQIELV